MTTSRKERIFGDLFAAGCGLIFYQLSVGVDKLSPRNLTWLTFGDQRAQVLGWWFFASDRWRWPPGANPNYGWEQMNSIVFTDSIPGLAFLFKALDIEAFDSGQYFGISLLLGSLALFVGARRLFSCLGMGLWPSIVGTSLLCTTPVFWWMQRWYVALSSGVALLVWAFYFYFDNQGQLHRLWRRWPALLVAASAVQAYLVIPIVGFFVAALANRLIARRDKVGVLLTVFTGTCLSCVGAMFVFGYYTVPSKWAKTGGYGWYSANVLGIVDQNGASQLLPDLPSVSGQYEPTSVGTGTLLLVSVLGILSLRRKSWSSISAALVRHIPLVAVLAVFAALAITNSVSIGSWMVKVPIPSRLEQGLSVFRSSARFLWPSIVVLSASVIVLASKQLKRSLPLLVAALLLQIGDYSREFQTVSAQSNGKKLDIAFDEGFWSRVPPEYKVIAAHPAASLGQGWAECAYAAVKTNRVGACGYFGRVQGLENVNRVNSNAFFKGKLDPSTIYWVSVEWLKTHRLRLLTAFRASRTDTVVVHELGALSGSSVLVFLDCSELKSCTLVGNSVQPLDKFLLELQPPH